ncbi:MAG: RNA polymerase sigma factor [Myxococcales bacterium]|nr:RNA polymerase sigma factor [Myxococcales bacterium]
MAAYVAGDSAAFRELFARLAPTLFRVLRRQLATEADATDLLQLTFLHLHRARNDFRPDARLKPWLYTIAYNLKREHFRRAKRRPEAPLELDGRSDPAVGPTGHDRADAAQAVRLALAQLPESQAEVIVLHWLEGLSFPEVAEALGVTVSAVKVRAHRGYAGMRKILGESGGNSEPGSGIGQDQ